MVEIFFFIFFFYFIIRSLGTILYFHKKQTHMEDGQFYLKGPPTLHGYGHVMGAWSHQLYFFLFRFPMKFWLSNFPFHCNYVSNFLPFFWPLFSNSSTTSFVNLRSIRSEWWQIFMLEIGNSFLVVRWSPNQFVFNKINLLLHASQSNQAMCLGKNVNLILFCINKKIFISEEKCTKLSVQHSCKTNFVVQSNKLYYPIKSYLFLLTIILTKQKIKNIFTTKNLQYPKSNLF